MRVAALNVLLDIGVISVGRAFAEPEPSFDDHRLLLGAVLVPLFRGRIGYVVGAAEAALVIDRVEDVAPGEQVVVALPNVAGLVHERLPGSGVVVNEESVDRVVVSPASEKQEITFVALGHERDDRQEKLFATGKNKVCE